MIYSPQTPVSNLQSCQGHTVVWWELYIFQDLLFKGWKQKICCSKTALTPTVLQRQFEALAVKFSIHTPSSRWAHTFHNTQLRQYSGHCSCIDFLNSVKRNLFFETPRRRRFLLSFFFLRLHETKQKQVTSVLGEMIAERRMLTYIVAVWIICAGSGVPGLPAVLFEMAMKHCLGPAGQSYSTTQSFFDKVWTLKAE